jgi:hypothetical protein
VHGSGAARHARVDFSVIRVGAGSDEVSSFTPPPSGAVCRNRPLWPSNQARPYLTLLLARQAGQRPPNVAREPPGDGLTRREQVSMARAVPSPRGVIAVAIGAAADVACSPCVCGRSEPAFIRPTSRPHAPARDGSSEPAFYGLRSVEALSPSFLGATDGPRGHPGPHVRLLRVGSPSDPGILRDRAEMPRWNVAAPLICDRGPCLFPLRRVAPDPGHGGRAGDHAAPARRARATST